jgi:hypothetical protein
MLVPSLSHVLHRQFLNLSQPEICVLLDTGTKPAPQSIYHLWKAFHDDPHLGGACGMHFSGMGSELLLINSSRRAVHRGREASPEPTCGCTKFRVQNVQHPRFVVFLIPKSPFVIDAAFF